MASAPCSRGSPVRGAGAQIAADIGGRQADAAQPGNHDMGEILADAAAQRERHRRRGGHGGGADLIDDVGLDAVDEFDRGVEHRPAGRKTLPHIVADLRIERDDAARKQKMRRRQRADVAGREGVVADLLPRPASRGGIGARASTATRADSFTVSVSCGSSISIQVRRLPKKSWPFAPVHRLGHDLQRGDMDPLAVARHRRQPQHVARMRRPASHSCRSSSAARRRSRQRLPHRFGALVVGQEGDTDRVRQFHQRFFDIDDQLFVDRRWH